MNFAPVFRRKVNWILFGVMPVLLVLFQNFSAPPVQPTSMVYSYKSTPGINGNIDGFTIIGGQPHLTGWACDYGNKKSILVHLYLGGRAKVGTYAGAYLASASNEPEVNSNCRTTAAFHRFYIPMTDSMISLHEGKAIHVHGISLSGLNNPELRNSGLFFVPKASDLSIDGKINKVVFSQAKSSVAGTIDRTIYGWACDLESSSSVQVHVYVGAPAGRTGATFLKKAIANIDAGSSSGVAKRCGFKNGAHRFEIPLTEAEVDAHAGKAIFIHAISATSEGRNGLLIKSGQFIVPQKRKTVSDVNDIQKALDAAFDEGGAVVAVKSGVYPLAANLNIRSNTALISEDGVRYVRSNPINFIRNRLDTAKDFGGYGNIAILGGIWDGNSVNYPQSHASFALGYAENLIIRGVTILDVTGGGHAIDLASSRDVLIEDSHFLGLVMSGVEGEHFKEAVQIDHNTPVTASTVASFAFGTRDGSTNLNIIVRNNYFGANPDSDNPASAAWPVGVGGHGAVFDKFQNQILIEKNVFSQSSYSGVRVMKWNNVVIRNNEFNNCNMAVRATPAPWNSPFAMDAGRTKSFGISQAGTNLAISDNVISGSKIDAIAIFGVAGDEAQNVAPVSWKKVNISGNTFKNISSHAISLDRAENFSITSNKITGLAAAAWGVRVYNSNLGTLVGNEILGGKNGGIYVPAQGNLNVTVNGVLVGK